MSPPWKIRQFWISLNRRSPNIHADKSTPLLLSGEATASEPRAEESERMVSAAALFASWYAQQC
jgi:hypothetical protein